MKNYLKQSRLSDCIEQVIDYRGKTPKKLGGDWSEAGYRAVSANNVKHDGLQNIDSIRYLDEALYKKWMKVEVKRGDLLLTSEAPAGQIMVWDSEEKIVLSQRIYGLRVNDKFNNWFLKYYLQSKTGQREIFRNNSGSTVFGISAETFDNILICHPEKSEQINIGKLLSTLDSKIEINRRINVELESLVRTIFDYWFVQFDFPDQDKKPYKHNGGEMLWNEKLKRNIPGGWEVDNILKVGDLLGGGTPKTNVPSYWGNEIPFFTPRDTDDTIFVLSTQDNITKVGLDSCSSKLYPKGTVFITARGTVGNINVAAQDMAMNQSCYALRPKPEINYYFLHQCAINLVHYLKAKSNGSIFDAIVSNDIKLTPIVIPPIPLIHEFGQITQGMYETILVNKRENKILTELRNWLMPMLINGQVTIRNANNEIIKDPPNMYKD